MAKSKTISEHKNDGSEIKLSFHISITDEIQQILGESIQSDTFKTAIMKIAQNEENWEKFRVVVLNSKVYDGSSSQIKTAMKKLGNNSAVLRALEELLSKQQKSE